MNAFSSLYHTFRAGHSSLAANNARWLNVMQQLWRAAELGAIITFVTGIVVGLLIPSADWLAISMVIVAGVVLRTIVKTIDSKWADCEKRKLEIVS